MSTKDTYTPFPLAGLESEAISSVPLEPRFHVVLQSETCRFARCAEASAAWNRHHLANLAEGISHGDVRDFPGADRYDPAELEAHESVFFWAYVGFHYERENARLEEAVAAQPAGTFECGHGKEEHDAYEDDFYSGPTFEEEFEEAYVTEFWPRWDEEWLKHLDDLEAAASK